MKTFQFINEKIEAGIPSMLLFVAESKGSSPGREGFNMAVSADGTLCGSIGGGFMEHKLIELARAKLSLGKTVKPFLKAQIHRKSAKKDQSGMICSGEQQVLFYYIDGLCDKWIKSLLSVSFKGDERYLCLTEKGLFIFEKAIHTTGFQLKENGGWIYFGKLHQKNKMLIIGGGHCSAALSQQMALLNFEITVLDDRKGLNTMADNNWAIEKKVVDYQDIEGALPLDLHNYYIVIMTFGYRPDKVVLKQLLAKDCLYLGMLGSKAKISQLLSELKAEGYSSELLNKVHTPIGLQIYSKTPAEIAVSIAAEIIREKNKKV